MKKNIIITVLAILFLIVIIANITVKEPPKQVIVEPIVGGERIGQKTIFSATSTAGVGTGHNIEKFSNCVVTVFPSIASTTEDSITYKFMGASTDFNPNFDSTAVTTSGEDAGVATSSRIVTSWDYVAVTELNGDDVIDGSTGDDTDYLTGSATYTRTATGSITAISLTEGVKRYKLVDDNLKWLNLEITDITNGTTTDTAPMLTSYLTCKEN